jgi:alkaline phosphatase D
MKNFALLLFVVASLTSCTFQKNKQNTFESNWEYQPNRMWAGPDYSTETPTAWSITDGALQFKSDKKGTFINNVSPISFKHDTLPLDISLDINTSVFKQEECMAGIQFADTDTKHTIQIGILSDKKLILLKNDSIISSETFQTHVDTGNINLQIKVEIQKGKERFNIALKQGKKSILTTSYRQKSLSNWSDFNLFVKNNKPHERTIQFEKLKLAGKRLQIDRSKSSGPVAGTIQGVNGDKRRMVIYFMPLSANDYDTLLIDIRKQGDNVWRDQAKIAFNPANNRVVYNLDTLDNSENWEYRIIYKLPYSKETTKYYYHSGLIKSLPSLDKKKNIIFLNGKADENYSASFVENILGETPDLVVFTGNHTGSEKWIGDTSITKEAYYVQWLLFLNTYHNLLSEVPAILLPGKLDVNQEKIWGNQGEKKNNYPIDSIFPSVYRNKEYQWHQQQGGYLMRNEYINYVYELQTAHIPFDTKFNDSNPVATGSINYQGIDIALLESYYYKTSPEGIFGDTEIYNGIPRKRWTSAKTFDVENATIYGKQQIEFLENWAKNWQESSLKIMLSQEPKYAMATYPDSFFYISEYPELPNIVGNESDKIKLKDLSFNSWPQAERNKVIEILRSNHILDISGTDNIGAVVIQGVNRWGDANYSFDVPSVSPISSYRWTPEQTKYGSPEDYDKNCGDYFDSFLNRLRILAVVNTENKSGEVQYYGKLEFSPENGSIQLYCKASTKEGTQNIDGWPIKLSIADNYNRPARNYLPPIKIENDNTNKRIVTVKDDNGEIVYSLPINGKTFTPKVFERGTYSMEIQKVAGEKPTIIRDIQSAWKVPSDTLFIR